MSFLLGLASLSIIILRFIHVVVCISHSCLLFEGFGVTKKYWARWLHLTNVLTAPSGSVPHPALLQVLWRSRGARPGFRSPRPPFCEDSHEWQLKFSLLNVSFFDKGTKTIQWVTPFLQHWLLCACLLPTCLVLDGYAECFERVGSCQMQLGDQHDLLSCWGS